VIVLAGDVHTGKNGIKWILETFPDRLAIYVLGNHEFYGQKISKLIDEIKEVAQGTNVHVLENESVEIGNVCKSANQPTQLSNLWPWLIAPGEYQS
jgi:hypothetical protein